MKNLKQEKLYKQVFYQIRNYIIENEIHSGGKLPTEAEMCEMMGVSRNVLREAIKALELIGVVKSKPGVGIVVQEFNMDFFYQNMFLSHIIDDRKLIDEILDVRKKLELSYLREAFNTISEEDINALEAIIESDSEIRFEDRDKEFHMTMYNHLNNKTLSSILEAAWYFDRRINGMYTMYDSHKELIENHVAITTALRKKDFAMFKEAMEYHFSSGLYDTTGKYRG